MHQALRFSSSKLEMVHRKKRERNTGVWWVPDYTPRSALNISIGSKISCLSIEFEFLEPVSELVSEYKTCVETYSK